jgi:hypothetical protein
MGYTVGLTQLPFDLIDSHTAREVAQHPWFKGNRATRDKQKYA